jgi:pimeloyl-ACP methyl ester carboxylesterase
MIPELFPSVDPHVARAVDRFVRWGLSGHAAARVLAGVVEDGTPLDAAWVQEGRRWEGLAEEARQQGATVTESLYAKQAFFSYRVADFSHVTNTPQKLEAYRGTLRAFGPAARHAVRPIGVDAEGRRYRGIVVGDSLPPGGPGAVFIYGADGNKEEHVWASAAGLVARGVKVLVVDGPGQGGAVRLDEIPARHDFEVVGTPAFDALVGAGAEPSRIGLVGSSMGGYYGPRVFARDRRYRALVLNSALYDATVLWDHYPPIRDQLAYNVQTPSHQDARAAYESFTLDAVRADLEGEDRPSLVVHGSADIYIPVSEGERVAGALGPRAELVVWEGATHNLGNVSLEAVPRMWDWLAARLAENG